ncbi:putative Macrophage migration inhibitory factor-like protein [Hypsibius exemplaris]|uniref:L-dopachrome isomerase n=1 Tax=Hypsibius exemplaris TaxID=2072580 RepID=A0A1W0WKU3_HYPEX|nr:putative Macrophage migration inhibitory factor-like protein [Hypsibius exemplaris]
MPIFVLNTNLKKSAIPEGFCNDVSELLAKVLQKEKYYFCAHINSDQQLTYAGTDEPAAYGTLSSIGEAIIGGEHNVAITNALYPFLEAKLGIKNSRLCIVYHRLIGSEVAFEARTLSEMK